MFRKSRQWLSLVALSAAISSMQGLAQYNSDGETLPSHHTTANCNMTPLTVDGYTALIDPFDGTTSAQVNGVVSYHPGVRGLGESLEFSEGASLVYPLKGWYSWSSDYSPDGKGGSIELWIKPASGNAGDFLMINWNNSSTPASAGYITHLGLDAQNRLTFGGWTSITNNPFDTEFDSPHSVVPPGKWVHIAYTWSPYQTAVYVNGELEAVSSLDYYPALADTVYVYVNPFGSNVIKAIDELRISTIARAELTSCADQPRD